MLDNLICISNISKAITLTCDQIRQTDVVNPSPADKPNSLH